MLNQFSDDMKKPIESVPSNQVDALPIDELPNAENVVRPPDLVERINVPIQLPFLPDPDQGSHDPDVQEKKKHVIAHQFRNDFVISKTNRII